MLLGFVALCLVSLVLIRFALRVDFRISYLKLHFPPFLGELCMFGVGMRSVFVCIVLHLCGAVAMQSPFETGMFTL